MSKLKSIVKSELFKITVVALIGFTVFRIFYTPVVVTGDSMHPTLEDKQFRLTSNYIGQPAINRFDIVVARYAQKNLVKRVIGLPNEEISFLNNTLYVNSSPVEETYLERDVVIEDFIVKLADDEYFLLGDNRSVSYDSREYGPFKVNQIKASVPLTNTKLYIFIAVMVVALAISISTITGTDILEFIRSRKERLRSVNNNEVATYSGQDGYINNQPSYPQGTFVKNRTRYIIHQHDGRNNIVEVDSETDYYSSDPNANVNIKH